MALLGGPMKHLINFLILSTIFCTFYASANTLTDSISIPDGVYTNESDPNGACSVEVKTESKLWSKHSVTVFRKSLHPDIIPDKTVKSDSFSFKEMGKQVLENNGKFLIITKKTSSKTRQVSGQIFEQGSYLFLEILVSKKACLGFCTTSVASCTVQLP